ncbi:MotE family protein [Tuberibacillus sp. Marseille-P3662]|uniref:MotE family protein n=1 Tax=Tuberibacillus sp. Marseille-P3662 TaxID=1965358 RepID=UPI000A1C944E|nr:hypothetical protein [Tuberibacillus sp. Marseille-P3662]
MEDSPRKPSFALKILKLLLVVIIALMFASTVTWMVLKVLGYEPTSTMTSWANQVPVVGALAENDTSATPSSAEFERLQEEVKQKSKQIKQLEQQLTQAQTKNEQWEKQNQSLKQDKKQLKQTESDQQAKFNVITDTYENMEPGKAAAILAKMDHNKAAEYLNVLSNDVKASILENMTAEEAAALTSLLDVNQWKDEQTQNQ